MADHTPGGKSSENDGERGEDLHTCPGCDGRGRMGVRGKFNRLRAVRCPACRGEGQVTADRLQRAEETARRWRAV